MKERILEGALDLFSRYGQSKVRMEEIAAYINISKKTIYNHYKNKTTLFEEAVQYYTTALVSRMQEIMDDDSKDFAAKFHEFLSYSYLELGRKDSPFFEDMHMYNKRLEDAPIPYVQKKLAGFISSFIDTAKEEGNISKDIETVNTTYVFLNVMRGITSWDFRDRLPLSRVEILRSTIKIILEGLLTDKGRQVLGESLDE